MVNQLLQLIIDKLHINVGKNGEAIAKATDFKKAHGNVKDTETLCQKGM